MDLVEFLVSRNECRQARLLIERVLASEGGPNYDPTLGYERGLGL